MANLAQHLFHAYVRSHIPRAVITGEQELELFAGLPGLIATQHPSRLGAFDVSADPGFQNEIHHAAVPPRAAGQGWYVYSKLFSRLNLSSGKLYSENGTGLRPSSDVTRVLSNTVFQTRYGMNTFIKEAPWPTGPLRFDRNFTEPLNDRSANGKKMGLRFCWADASAVVNSRNVCDAIPEERW